MKYNRIIITKDLVKNSEEVSWEYVENILKNFPRIHTGRIYMDDDRTKEVPSESIIIRGYFPVSCDNFKILGAFNRLYYKYIAQRSDIHIRAYPTILLYDSEDFGERKLFRSRFIVRS